MSLRDHLQAAGHCASCWLATAVLIAVVAGSFAYLSLGFDQLFATEAWRYMAEFFFSFFPPDTSREFVLWVGKGSLETLAISSVGTLIAAAIGLVFALPASGRYGFAAKALGRFALNFLRSVPELVWAAIMVLAAGLGPFAGTLALAAHTTGVLGRLFAETLENAPPEPTLALVETGTPAPVAFLYGTLPGVLAQFIGYALYRWEMNIRMASILGFVGAGGLGQLLYFSLSLFQQKQAATVILAMFALVVLVDGTSAIVRRRLVRAGG